SERQRSYRLTLRAPLRTRAAFLAALFRGRARFLFAPATLLAALALRRLRLAGFCALLVHDPRGDFLLAAFVAPFFFKLVLQFFVFTFPFWTSSSWHISLLRSS